METIAQTISGSSSSGGKGTVTIFRNGDLVHKVYVKCDNDVAQTATAGVISEVKIEIGGQEIDKHTHEWLQVWSELTTQRAKAFGYKLMTGCTATNSNNTSGGGVANCIIPLQFWFVEIQDSHFHSLLFSIMKLNYNLHGVVVLEVM